WGGDGCRHVRFGGVHTPASPKVLVFRMSLSISTGPNAGHQARLEAGARHERTLEGVACMPWFGSPPLVCRLPCGGHCLCPRWASHALEPVAEGHGETATALDDDSTGVERALQWEACRDQEHNLFRIAVEGPVARSVSRLFQVDAIACHD